MTGEDDKSIIFNKRFQVSIPTFRETTASVHKECRNSGTTLEKDLVQ